MGEAAGPYPVTGVSFCALAFGVRFLAEEMPSAPLGPIVTGVKVIGGPVVATPSAEIFGFLDLLGGG